MRKLSSFLTLLLVLGLVLVACTPATGTAVPGVETEAPLETATTVETEPVEPAETQTPAVEPTQEATQSPAATQEAVTEEAATAQPEATASPEVTGTEIIPETGMQGQVRAASLLDQPVTTTANEQVGEVVDIALNLAETDVEYLLLRLESQAEENENIVTPVPWRAFQVNPEGSVVVVVGSDVLEGATTLDMRAVPMLIPDDWSEEFGVYWDEQLPASTPVTPAEDGEATPEATPEEDGLEGILLTGDLIDQPIQTANGQEIGSITDLVIDVSNGQVTYVLLAPGESLGLGENIIPVPIQSLRRDAESLAFQLQIDPAILQNAPSFNLEELPNPTSQEWVDAIRSFWEGIQAP